MSAGIDYSLGTVNVDKETGIHFGVIHQDKVLQAWADDSELVYPDREEAGFEEWAEDEPIGSSYSRPDEGYFAWQNADNPDIMVMASPYYTYTKYCSPCYPGAGDLDSPDPEGVMTYCFGPDWFEDGRAPYPVYYVLARPGSKEVKP